MHDARAAPTRGKAHPMIVSHGDESTVVVVVLKEQSLLIHSLTQIRSRKPAQFDRFHPSTVLYTVTSNGGPRNSYTYH